MRKCTLRYVWMGTSYKSELTIMNTAAFLPMIRHLNKCSWCVCWNMRSHREKRLAVTWGCQLGIKNITRTKGTESKPDSTWKLDTNFLSLQYLNSASSLLKPAPLLYFLWLTYKYAFEIYVWCPSFPPLRPQGKCCVQSIKIWSSSPT